jgi:hypothetical protein
MAALVLALLAEHMKSTAELDCNLVIPRTDRQNSSKIGSAILASNSDQNDSMVQILSPRPTSMGAQTQQFGGRISCLYIYIAPESVAISYAVAKT